MEINDMKRMIENYVKDSVSEVEAVNQLREVIHALSPNRNHPVDCILWVPAKNVVANDYNPNSVAPPEMQLLDLSIEADGYTQPIVACKNRNNYEVVDGFHRHLIGKKRNCEYLPVATIRNERNHRNNRIAATIRHNRARGKHSVDGMSAIVLELRKRNWSDKKIGKELGMEPDEVLRLAQISGLAELFSDKEFSEAWE